MLVGFASMRLPASSSCVRTLDLPDECELLNLAEVESLLRPCLADKGQDPESRPRLHPHLMTLLTRSSIWSFKKNRVALGEEHLAAQGVPVFENCTVNGLFQCPYKSMLPPLSQAALRSLAGNAICIPVIGFLLSFVIAVTEPRETLKIGRPIAPCDPADHAKILDEVDIVPNKKIRIS